MALCPAREQPLLISRSVLTLLNLRKLEVRESAKITESNPTTPTPPQNLSLSVTSAYLLNTSGVMTQPLALGTLFQGSTTLLAKKLLQKLHPNLSSSNMGPFLSVPPFMIQEKSLRTNIRSFFLYSISLCLNECQSHLNSGYS